MIPINQNFANSSLLQWATYGSCKNLLHLFVIESDTCEQLGVDITGVPSIPPLENITRRDRFWPEKDE